MPKRRGIVFSSEHVRGANISNPINVGETNTIRMMEELGRPVNFGSGKIYLKRGSFGKGKERAQKAFFKPLFGDNHSGQRNEGERSVRIMDALRLRGLPVPKAGLIEHHGQLYLAMSPYLRKGGLITKMIPVNTSAGSHTPHFLKTLNVERNADLIRQMAKDTAEIFNAGMYTKAFDFFGFYRKKDGTLARFIMDVDYFYDAQGPMHQKEGVNSMFADIKSVWKPRRNPAELELFASTMKESLESDFLKKAVDEAVAKKSRGVFGYLKDIFSP